VKDGVGGKRCGLAWQKGREYPGALAFSRIGKRRQHYPHTAPANSARGAGGT